MKSVIVILAALYSVTFASPADAKPEVYGSPKGSDVNMKVIDFEQGSKEVARNATPHKKCDNMLCRPLRCRDEPDGTQYCFGMGAIGPGDARAKLDPGRVLEAVRKIGLPSLGVNIQPGDATLVNLDTIFYARPRPFARSVTLLGYDIDLAATPVLYRWHHGDGTSHTTSDPGGPYPSKEVTYRYRQPAKHVSPSVDVTYRVRYRVDGGDWQDLGQTLTAAGPPSDLEVKEAGAVLTTY